MKYKGATREEFYLLPQRSRKVCAVMQGSHLILRDTANRGAQVLRLGGVLCGSEKLQSAVFHRDG